MALNRTQIRFLRGLCHDLSPVVIVADKGLTANVRSEVELALDSRIKKDGGDAGEDATWRSEALAEFNRYVARVEIVNEADELERVYFRYPAMCELLTLESRQQVCIPLHLLAPLPAALCNSAAPLFAASVGRRP